MAHKRGSAAQKVFVGCSVDASPVRARQVKGLTPPVDEDNVTQAPPGYTDVKCAVNKPEEKGCAGLITHHAKDFKVGLGLTFSIKPDVKLEDKPGRELYIKLWLASAAVNSSSLYQYAALNLKVTVSAWRLDDTAPKGIKTIKLRPLDASTLVVTTGEVTDDTGRTYTLKNWNVGGGFTVAKEPQGTVDANVGGTQNVHEAAQVGDVVKLVMLEHTNNHFHALNTASACTVILERNIYSTLLCKKGMDTESLAQIGGHLNKGNGLERQPNDGVNFIGWTGSTQDVPVYVQVTVQLVWAKSKKLKRTETTIGRYLIEDMVAKKQSALEGVVTLEVKQLPKRGEAASV